MVLLTKKPPAVRIFISQTPPTHTYINTLLTSQSQGRRLLILGTTSQRSVLRQLDLQPIFNYELAVPSINTHKELAAVLREVRAFDSEAELARSLHELRETTGTDQVGVGIKKVLLGVEKAKEEKENVPSRLADIIAQQMAANMD
jgi:vesicle-fusing ATPase